MKLDNFKNDIDVISTSNQETDFSIDQESLGVLFKGFSDNLYSNKIGSIVREVTSNCFDSHIEAGVDTPVEIELINGDPIWKEHHATIIFKDFGVGLSPERVRDIYSKYFASTKRTTNDQIGGFGIGAKSPLAYTESFFVTTWHDGTRYEYVIHRGEKVPKIILQHSEPEARQNGTEVKLPIKNRYDASRFREEIKSQLRYFSNINYKNCEIDNDYRIVRGEHFILRVAGGEVVDKELSICLGNVAYPLDKSYFQEQKLDTRYNQKIQFALTFEVGDLPVTMNREAIEYTDEAVNRIANKILAVREELRKMVSDQPEISFDAWLNLPSSNSLMHLEAHNITFDAGPLHPGSQLRLEGFPPEINPNRGDMFAEYSIPSCIEGGRIKKSYSIYVKNYLANSALMFRSSTQIYSKRKNLYIEDQHSKKPYILVQNLLSDSQMKRLLCIDHLPNADQILEKFRSAMLKEIVQRTHSYERTEISEDWMKEYEDELKENRLNRNVTFVIRKGDEIVNGYHRMIDVTASDLPRWVPKGGLAIYYTQDEEPLKRALPDLQHLINRNINWFKVAKQNTKYLHKTKGFMHIIDAVEKFKNAKNRAKYAKYFENVSDEVFHVMGTIGSKKGLFYCKMLSSYYKKYYDNASSSEKPAEPIWYTYEGNMYNLTDIAEKLTALGEVPAFKEIRYLHGYDHWKDQIMPILRKQILKEHLTTLIY